LAISENVGTLDGGQIASVQPVKWP
jgi:hypothetical protein